MTCGGVDLTATFLSPIEVRSHLHPARLYNNLTKTQPTDLVNQSIPFSYLTVEAASSDGSSHTVQVYTDVTGEWLVPGSLQESDQLFQWQAVAGDTINYQFSLQNQTQFLQVNGRARYGSVMYSTKKVVPSLLCQLPIPGLH